MEKSYKLGIGHNNDMFFVVDETNKITAVYYNFERAIEELNRLTKEANVKQTNSN